jgi:hypothetical protein
VLRDNPFGSKKSWELRKTEHALASAEREIAALREQVRVLREALERIARKDYDRPLNAEGIARDVLAADHPDWAKADTRLGERRSYEPEAGTEPSLPCYCNSFDQATSGRIIVCPKHERTSAAAFVPEPATGEGTE